MQVNMAIEVRWAGFDFGRFAEADFVISDFRELKTILRGPKEKQ